MPIDFKTLANPGISQLTPYVAGKPIEELQREYGIDRVIKLASNENPLGPSPNAIKAAENAIQTMAFYPDSNAYTLKNVLSKYFDITPEQIIVGNGTDSVLRLIAQVFVKAGEEMIISEHAFAIFAIIANIVGAKLTTIPEKNWHHDLKAMANAITDNTKLILIANPNNPTGTWFNETALIEFLNATPEHVIIVLDEAYYGYVAASDYPNTLKLQQTFPNLITTRTFSKLYALAGLRIGFSVSHPDIAELLNRARPPFDVNIIAQAAAIAALYDKDHVKDSLLLNQRGMLMLENAFKEMTLDFIPSSANFLTVDLRQDAKPIYEALLKRGVIVRPLANYAMPNHLRVTIGTQEENTIFLNALKQVLNDDQRL